MLCISMLVVTTMMLSSLSPSFPSSEPTFFSDFRERTESVFLWRGTFAMVNLFPPDASLAILLGSKALLELVPPFLEPRAFLQNGRLETVWT